MQLHSTILWRIDLNRFPILFFLRLVTSVLFRAPLLAYQFFSELLLLLIHDAHRDFLHLNLTVLQNNLSYAYHSTKISHTEFPFYVLTPDASIICIQKAEPHFATYFVIVLKLTVVFLPSSIYQRESQSYFYTMHLSLLSQATFSHKDLNY
jgi:hypothetical protein